MKRHSTDLLSLIFGIIFVGIAGWWVAGRFVTVDVPQVGWFVAGALIVIGVLGVAGSLRGEPDAAAPEPAPNAPVGDAGNAPGGRTPDIAGGAASGGSHPSGQTANSGSGSDPGRGDDRTTIEIDGSR